MIGCLVLAAGIAVVAVLVGKFSDTLGRALATIAMVALHAAFGLGYITGAENRGRKDGGRSIELFGNAVFTLIVASFVTSIFAIWHILGAWLAIKMYMLYGVLLFATLHADVLYRIRRFESRINTVVAANYFFMAAVVGMLVTVIFVEPHHLGDFFFRLLAACGIVDATLSITAIIMHKLYLQKHPELTAKANHAAAASSNFWKNPLVVLLIIFLGLQVAGSAVALVLRGH